MSKIRNKDTKPELLVRKWLWVHGYRYRLHYKKLPGKPDIVFPSRKKAIFVHGCFWHRHECKYFKWPESNAEFWRQKIEESVHRDKNNLASLIDSGWICLVVWECALKDINQSNRMESPQSVGRLIEKFLTIKNTQSMEIDSDGIHKLIISY